MRGGKRENAGRKGYGKTKVYRLPIALEPKIKALLEEYKTEYDKKHRQEKLKNETVTLSKKESPKTRATKNESVTKSITSEKSTIPRPSNKKKRAFKKWLIKHKWAKNQKESEEMTKTPEIFWINLAKYGNMAMDRNLRDPETYKIFDMWENLKPEAIQELKKLQNQKKLVKSC